MVCTQFYQFYRFPNHKFDGKLFPIRPSQQVAQSMEICGKLWQRKSVAQTAGNSSREVAAACCRGVNRVMIDFSAPN